MSNLELQRISAEIQAIKESSKSLVYRLEETEKSFREMPSEVKAQLSVTPEELEKLPWKEYQPGKKAGWIYADLEEAEDLRRLLESVNHPVKIGDFSYRLSRGKTRNFITRKPISRLPLHLRE